MRTTDFNFTSGVKKPVRVSFRSKRAEIIAWVIFFGIGVSYFVLTLCMAAS